MINVLQIKTILATNDSQMNNIFNILGLLTSCDSNSSLAP